MIATSIVGPLLVSLNEIDLQYYQSILGSLPGFVRECQSEASWFRLQTIVYKIPCTVCSYVFLCPYTLLVRLVIWRTSLTDTEF